MKKGTKLKYKPRPNRSGGYIITKDATEFDNKKALTKYLDENELKDGEKIFFVKPIQSKKVTSTKLTIV